MRDRMAFSSKAAALHLLKSMGLVELGKH